MNDAGLVGRVDGPNQFGDELGCPARRQRGVGGPQRQASPGAELQRQKIMLVVLADLVSLDDVGVGQPGDGLGLGPEAEQKPDPAWGPVRIIFSATRRLSFTCRAV
jgi:hypothetical protein